MSDCHFAHKSRSRCVSYPSHQTLDELDLASMKVPGKHMKISWLILSRVGIHYLSSTFGSWTVCIGHRKEFLDAWQVSPQCSHPDHNIMETEAAATHLVTMVMSVKLLQNEAKVVPISSKFCDKCMLMYAAKYSSKPGEKLVVVVPKTTTPAVESPFCSEPSQSSSEKIENVPLNIMPRGVLTSTLVKKEPMNDDLKTELVIENSKRASRSSAPRRRPETAITDEDEDILSHDSDDDPTWNPGEKEEDKADKEDALLQTFVPRKRKRIGPEDIGKKAKVQLHRGGGRGRPKKTAPVITENSDSEVDSEELLDMSEEANRIVGAGGTDFHYFCKICQISFYKHAAFKHHVFNSVELHKQIQRKEKRNKEAEMEYECSDCCIAFQDRKSHQTHMIEEHTDTSGNPFYCQKCNVYLKSESAFKSHNSKLHLERREKSYYCRECDETFSCLIKHSLHIVVHRTWTQEEMGMQCRICGKVFTRNQTLPFHRHLATHDTEPETECSCGECLGKPVEEKSEEAEQDPLDIRASPRKQRANLSKSNLLKKMQSLLSNEGDDDVEEDDKDALKPYECGLCANAKFSTVENLQKHVDNVHSNDEAAEKEPKKVITEAVIDQVADEFANEVADLEAKTKPPKLAKAKKAHPRSAQQERNWQECPDRNWAAEFGYGGKTSVGPAKDLLSKMALSFKLANDDEEEEDEKANDSGVSVDDDDKIFRTRGFKGTIKASLNRAPRTLSSSSLRTRKRMEALMRRAREFMKKDKAKKSEVKKVGNAPEKVDNKPQRVASKEAKATKVESSKEKEKKSREEKKSSSLDKPLQIEVDDFEDEDLDEDLDEEDEDFDGISDGDEDEDDSEGLLIPLENGWVCEKRLADAHSYSTHFWSPDGQRHGSLTSIKSYGTKKKLKLNMAIFERALKSNPHK